MKNFNSSPYYVHTINNIPINIKLINFDDYLFKEYTQDKRIVIDLDIRTPSIIFVFKKLNNISQFHYQNIISLSNIWKGYPSLNCNFNGIINHQEVTKNRYLFIPKKNSVFGIGPKDLLNGFKYLKINDIDTLIFDKLLNNFYEDAFGKQLQYQNLEQLQDLLDVFNIPLFIKYMLKVNKTNTFFIKDLINSFIYYKDSLNFIDYLVLKVFPPFKNHYIFQKTLDDINIKYSKYIWYNDDYFCIKEDIINNI